MARYIIRIDDVAPNMNWPRYFQLKQLLDRHGVKALAGVIPDNRDPELLQFPKCKFDFWSHIRKQQDDGWAIAVHGHQHLLTSPSGGVLQRHESSEFAGLSFDEQVGKLQKARGIMEQNGLKSEIFMPPAHGYDDVTLQVLQSLKFRFISDGVAMFPVLKAGLLHVPQQFANPRPMPFGLFTFCFHPNTLTEKELDNTESFLRSHGNETIAFGDAVRFRAPGWSQKPAEIVLKVALKTIRNRRVSRGL